MAELNPLEYKQAIVGAVVGVVLAIAGISGPLNTVTVRPDPQTGSMALDQHNTLEESMKEWVRRHVTRELKYFEIELQARMPPPPTRLKIDNLEHFMHEKHPEFRSPTQEW